MPRIPEARSGNVVSQPLQWLLLYILPTVTEVLFRLSSCLLELRLMILEFLFLANLNRAVVWCPFEAGMSWNVVFSYFALEANPADTANATPSMAPVRRKGKNRL